MKYFILSMFLFLSSCSYFFDEKEATELSSFSFSEEQGCITDFFSIQFDYMASRASFAQAMASTECAQKSLAFIDSIIAGGETSGTLTQVELHALLNQVFFSDDPLSLSLVDYAVTMKSWVVGGYSDEFSKVELRKVIGLLEHWKEFLKGTRSSLPILHWEKGEGSLEEFEMAFSRVRGQLEIFLGYFPETIDPFEVKVVKGFFKELRSSRGEGSLSSYIDLFHGVVWVINGRDDAIDVEKTVIAFYEFLHSYRSYTYNYGSGFNEIFNNPKEFLNWLDGTIGSISESLGEDYVLPVEGFELIFNFLLDYLSSQKE